MEKINQKREFENSIKGIWNIISERKLYTKRVYYLTTIIIVLVNFIVLCINYFFKPLDYFLILNTYVSVFLPVLTTFCGFSMTAYSLVVGFLNYGIFKTFLEKWYQLKIAKEKTGEEFQTYTVYQKGIALFALAIIMLILTVVLLSLTKVILGLELKIENKYFVLINFLGLLMISLFSTWCFILVFYNIVNIFTFSQTINKLTYLDLKEKDE